MSALAKSLMAAAVAALMTVPAMAEDMPFGRPALAEEIAAWDIDVRPDGQGLPVGSGSAEQGEQLYYDYCAVCHGDFGEAVGRWPVLMGGFGTLAGEDPVKTVGSYWPYASTVYDYIHRAMPFGNAQSLTDDEVYSISLYVLYLNDLVEYETVYDQDTFASIEMPNADGFFMPDPRPDVPMDEPCMSNCDVGTDIVGKAAIIDVTPDDEDIGLSID